MIVHIFNRLGTIEEQFLLFMKANFNSEIHRYIVIGSPYGTEKHWINDNVSFAPEPLHFDLSQRKILTNCSKIVVHGLFSSRLCWFLAMHKKILAKTYIIFWGGDLYPYRDGQVGLKAKIRAPFTKLVIRQAGGVGYLTSGDYEIIKRNVGYQGEHYPVLYSFANNFSLLQDYQKPAGTPLFLLGNSATPTNRHMTIIDKLAQYMEFDFEVICPLSYGDESYRDAVIEHGARMLGNKFIPLLELMDVDAYQELLAKISVGFINSNRQQGMGNIYILLGTGAKVFLGSQTPMWDYFNKEVGVSVFDISQVGIVNFEKLIALPSGVANKNAEAIRAFLSPNEVSKKWNALFSS